MGSKKGSLIGKTVKKLPNKVDFIIKYESGELSDKDTLRLFSHLLYTKLAWQLQGHYGRTAQSLIKMKLISKKGKILKEAIK